MDPGTEQKPSFFLGAGKLEWPFDFNRQEEVWLSTCWLAAPSFPFSFPEVPAFCPGGIRRQTCLE